MASSLHDAYMQAAIAESAVRSVATPHDQALAALGVHAVDGLQHGYTVPIQNGLANAHDMSSAFQNGYAAAALPNDHNEVAFMSAQQQLLEAQLQYQAALHNLRNRQAHDDRQALLASLQPWNAPLGPLQGNAQAPHLSLAQQLGAVRPQQQQQPQQRRRGRRGGVRQHAYRNGLANRPGGATPQGQPAQSQASPSSQASDTAADQQTAAGAISGGTGVFLPSRPQPQPQPQPARRPAPSVPLSASAPLSRAAAIREARLQAAANMAACLPQPAAAYIPTSADLAASVRLAASGQLLHGGNLAPSAFFLQDPFLSGNSSLASTIYSPNGGQDMQGLISHFSGAKTGSRPASPRLTPMTTPRASVTTSAALRELIYPSSEDSSHSSANDVLLSQQDAAALLARASAGAGLAGSQSMLNLYNMRTSAADAPPRAATTVGLPSSRTAGDCFGHLWDT